MASIEKQVEGGGLIFERTISLGHVLTIVTMLVGMGGAYAAYKVTISTHELRLQQLELQMQRQEGINKAVYGVMWTIKQDVAVIRDRIERGALK